MTDFRALCARLADELDHYRQLLMDDRRETHALAAEARVALSQPKPEGPTDEELRELWNDGWDTSEEHSAFKFARAVLARWGRSDGPAVSDDREPASVNADPSDAIPADGEVAELVAWLRMYGSTGRQVLDQTPWTASQLDRAADLLERLSPPQPS